MDKLKLYTKQLRSNMPDAERILWYNLRAHRFCKLKFRRQVKIGNYIVDFLSYSHRLIIELDGDQHADQQIYDHERTIWLNSQGFELIRFWNIEIYENLDGTLQRIYDKCVK